MNIILNSNFVIGYISHIEPISYNTNIKLVKNKKIVYPVILKYTDKPVFENIFFSMPKLQIIQKWNLIDNIMIVDIDIMMNERKIGKINMKIIYKYILNKE